MALGCIGMSREDFERCTPFEFYKAWERWAEAKRDAERNEWERTRVLALFAIQPYAKNNLQAHDILPFPWDEMSQADAAQTAPLSEIFPLQSAFSPEPHFFQIVQILSFEAPVQSRIIQNDNLPSNLDICV